MNRQHTRECQILEHMLRGVGIENYVVEEDYIGIPFQYSNPDLFEEGEIEIWLYASLNEPTISLELPLLELSDGENEIDSTLAEMLAQANRQMGNTQFCLAPSELSLCAMFDSRELQPGEIEAGVTDLLAGFEIYLGILAQWFQSLVDSGAINFEQDQAEEKEIQRVTSGERSSMDPTKKQVIETLMGIASFGVKAAVVAGIAVLAGVPTAGVGAILTAYVGSKLATS